MVYTACIDRKYLRFPPLSSVRLLIGKMVTLKLAVNNFNKNPL